MLVAAEFNLLERELDFVHLFGDGDRIESGRAKATARDDAQLVVRQIDDLRGVFDDRGRVGRDDVLFVAYTDDERTPLAGDDDLVGRLA